MAKTIIKILSCVAGFGAGFLLFSLVGLNLDENIKLGLFIALWVLIIIAVIGIIIYYKIKNKDRLYNEVMDDILNHNIKKKLASLGADKSLVEFKYSDNEIRIMEINKGFNALLLIKRDKIIMMYEATADYNKLDSKRQEYVDNLMNEHISTKAYFKLTADELYKEFQEFINRTI